MVNIPTAPAGLEAEGIFVQPLTPIGNSLIGSFFVGLIPLLLVLVLLGIFKVPAQYSSLSGLIVCIFIAIFGWHMPAQKAFEAIGNGVVFANWPVMWIVVNAMFVYNITVFSGLFDYFRRWILAYTPPDTRIILLIIGYCFGALLEGVAGFGTPGAICSSLMVSVGFDPLDALTYTLLFDTTPVAFGALGIPVTTLASITGLPVMSLSAMMGRQLPLLSLLLPFYAMIFFAGFRAGLIECWPVALVAGLSFAVTQGIFANLVGPELPDLIAGIVSLVAVIGFVQFWRPKYRPEYYATMHTTKSSSIDEENTHNNNSQSDCNENQLDRVNTTSSKIEASEIEVANSQEEGNAIENIADKTSSQADHDMGPYKTKEKPSEMEVLKPNLREALLAWSPWILIVLVVIIWTFAKVPDYGRTLVQWPHLHEEVYLTLYGKRYSAIWNFEPLGTGTAILVSAFPFAAIVLWNGSHPKIFWLALKATYHQLLLPIFTVSFIMSFAYLYNYSGIAYTVGLTLSSVGRAFPFLSAWLGWFACFLSGSDTSANSLFGNLQVVAAREIGLSAVLMAATNSSGAITSKMISPQNLTTGVSTIGLKGQEGKVLRRTILHSLFLVCCVGAMACVQQYAIPGIIPPGDP
ncbi:lactate permease [Cokeromyces recurvatus]|uniref:lactate permease n=1 Tax=Cokeromyces recurvatus TaxID=90255 RepID=UPI00221FB9F8|nr:lactate permease [Cokeromyces recurvatus]KAI7907369.1 lactate permease [Cokeromyces recurvatus]